MGLPSFEGGNKDPNPPGFLHPARSCPCEAQAPPALTIALGAGGLSACGEAQTRPGSRAVTGQRHVWCWPRSHGRRPRSSWRWMAAEPQVPPSWPPVQFSQLFDLQHRNTLFENSPTAENHILPAEIRNVGLTCHLHRSLQPNR